MAHRFDELTQPKDWKYLLLTSSDENSDVIRNINPFTVSRLVKNNCHGTSLREIKSTNLGKSLLIVVSTSEAAEKLKKLTSIPSNNGSIPIKISESERLGTKQSIFFCRQITPMLDTEIISELNIDNPDIKVVGIRRLKRKDTTGTWNDTGSFVIQMRCNLPPNEIKIGYLIQTLRTYVPDPMRCFRCKKLELGHTGKRCREKKEGEMNCINCNEQKRTNNGVVLTATQASTIQPFDNALTT